MAKHSIRSWMRYLLLFISLTYSVFGYGGEATLIINQHTFDVELAVTKQERKTGLMGRHALPENSGMLFVYSEPKQISFWMKNTLIPLDILFFDENGKLLEVIQHAQPCPRTPCPTYTNQAPASFVLEIAAGSVQKYDINPGDIFTLEMP